MAVRLYHLRFVANTTKSRIFSINYAFVDFLKAKLAVKCERRIVVLPPGRMLVRAISMVFDRYLQANRQTTRYSKVI